MYVCTHMHTYAYNKRTQMHMHVEWNLTNKTTLGTSTVGLNCEVVLFLKVLNDQSKMASLINTSLQWVRMHM